MRLDAYVVQVVEGLTRNQLSNRLISASVNGKKAKLSTKIKENDLISVQIEDLPSLELTPEKMDLEIVYEDAQSLVINKPQGLLVHPGAGHPNGTLVNGLLGGGYLEAWKEEDFASQSNKIESDEEESEEEAEEENEENLVLQTALRPGIVHRLDKDTSGLLLVAKNLKALEYYSAAFKNREVKKFYVALVKGHLPLRSGKIESGFIRDPKNRKKFTMTENINIGKRALTYYQVIAESEARDFSFVLLFPWTGRTHQLRVHMTGMGCPIVGDPIYSRITQQFGSMTLMLHAMGVEFLPMNANKRVLVTTELPARMEKAVAKFGLDATLIHNKLSHLENYFND